MRRQSKLQRLATNSIIRSSYTVSTPGASTSSSPTPVRFATRTSGTQGNQRTSHNTTEETRTLSLRTFSRQFQTQTSSARQQREYEGSSRSYEYGAGAAPEGRRTIVKATRSREVRTNKHRRGPDSESRTVTGAHDRAVILTPWMGSPTILHALGFIREIEEKYGKIWWATLLKEDANPYEYRPRILIVFEDSASLERIPGLNRSRDGQDQLSSAPETKRPNNQTHIFVPWKDDLNDAAYKQGGPDLTSVLPFLTSKKDELERAEESKPASEDVIDELEPQASSSPASSPPDKPRWDEYDEPISIDALIRRWDQNTLYLPTPKTANAATRQDPYLRPTFRLNLARAFVDFGGFSKTPVESMASALDNWQAELEARRSVVWNPATDSEEPVDLEIDTGAYAEDDAAVSKLSEEDQLQWDDVTHAIPDMQARDVDDEELVPRKRQYQRIAADEDFVEEEDDSRWEGAESHPLQYPATRSPSTITEKNLQSLAALPETLDSMDAGVQHTPSGTPSDMQNPPILAQLDDIAAGKPAPSRNRHRKGPEYETDPWRTDPRPFRNGLGRDDPNEHMPGGREKWYNLGEDPSSSAAKERQQGAMMRGSHSPKTAARWAVDKRGRKLRSREDAEMLKEAGLSDLGDFDSLSSTGDREREARKQQTGKLKERLRAILDGTNV